MAGLRQLIFLVLLGFLVGLGAGCDRIGSGPGAEQREANYISGQNFAMQGQKEKAIASFEQAVLVNPSNSAAHLALGDLYYGQLEFINAAYHYGRYLQLLERRGQKPDITAADNQRNCEMQLAVKFSRELSRQQNDLEIDALRRQIAEKDSLIQRLQAQALSQGSSTNPVAVATSPAGQTRANLSAERSPVASTNAPVSNNDTVRSGSPSPAGSATAKAAPSSSARTHTVQSGETPSIIARKHGITLKALLAANPGLNPSRLKVGMVLKLPAQ